MAVGVNEDPDGITVGLDIHRLVHGTIEDQMIIPENIEQTRILASVSLERGLGRIVRERFSHGVEIGCRHEVQIFIEDDLWIIEIPIVGLVVPEVILDGNRLSSVHEIHETT